MNQETVALLGRKKKGVLCDPTLSDLRDLSSRLTGQTVWEFKRWPASEKKGVIRTRV